MNAVHAWITWKHCHKRKILSQELNLVPRTVLSVLIENLNLHTYKRSYDTIVLDVQQVFSCDCFTRLHEHAAMILRMCGPRRNLLALTPGLFVFCETANLYTLVGKHFSPNHTHGTHLWCLIFEKYGFTRDFCTNVRSILITTGISQREKEDVFASRVAAFMNNPLVVANKRTRDYFCKWIYKITKNYKILWFCW